MNRGKILILTAIILLTPFLTAGIMTLNPATDEEELILISNAKEREIGKNIDEQVRKQYALPVDSLMQKRVEDIGARLSPGSDRRDIIYRFTVLDDKKNKDKNYNAFAAPGGYIYIFSDLVEAMEKDDSVAGILAHEMGHVEARHAIKRLQGSIGLTALMLLGTQMETDQGTYIAANNAIGELFCAYSRQDERQADELSVKYMRLAGFNPDGAIEAFNILRELRKKAPPMAYFFYKTHPYLSERAAYLKNFIRGHIDFNSYINLIEEKGSFDK